MESPKANMFISIKKTFFCGGAGCVALPDSFFSIAKVLRFLRVIKET
jgi:hypothetical protein